MDTGTPAKESMSGRGREKETGAGRAHPARVVTA